MDLVYSDLKSHRATPHTVLSGKWTCTDNIGFRVLAKFYLVGTDQEVSQHECHCFSAVAFIEAYMDLWTHPSLFFGSLGIWALKIFRLHRQRLWRLYKVKVKSLSRVRLCNPMDCSLPGSSLHGILQVKVLEWIAISFSKPIQKGYTKVKQQIDWHRCIKIKLLMKDW